MAPKKKKGSAKKLKGGSSDEQRNHDEQRKLDATGLTEEAAGLLAEALTFKEHPRAMSLAMSELTLAHHGKPLGITLGNHPLGVLILNLVERDAAYSSGLRAGDIIIAVNHTKVQNHTEAAELMFKEDGNLELEVTYYTAAVADREIIRRRRPTEFVAIDLVVGGRKGHVGLTLQNHPLGVLVLHANPVDLAYQAGIRTNDVIVTLNGFAVIHHAEAKRLIDSIGESTGSVRLTYYPADAAANELVLVSSYGPRGSDLSESGLVTTSASKATSVDGEVVTGGSKRDINSNYKAFWTEREARQKTAWMLTERERRAEKGVPAPTEEEEAGMRMELNYSYTTSSAEPSEMTQV